MPAESFVDTSHARIAVRDGGGDGRPVLLVHGNSSCKEVFARQFDAPALQGLRLVAIDLPGHGASSDAVDPARSYTIGGYAEMAQEVVRHLRIERPLFFGWSLGGHVGLEMIGRGFGLDGVMISGTPPIAANVECLMQAFNIDPVAENLTAKRDFTEADALAYATHTSAVDGAIDPHLLAMVRRTDGRAREIMFGSVVQGEPLDKRAIVAAMTVPFAIVNGAEDPFIRPEYFETLDCASLWPRGVVRVEGAGHAPFLHKPEAFNALLAAFAA